MTFENYRLPDGRIVRVDATASKGAATITYELARGNIVTATRVDPSEDSPRNSTIHYTIRTDALLTTIDAADIDAAARTFAASEGYRDVATANDLLRRIAAIDDAWIWIESDEDDRIGGSTPDALADYLRQRNQ